MEKTFEISNPSALSVEDCLKNLNVTRSQGLEPEEAKRRLSSVGRNALPEKKRKWIGWVFCAQFYNPLVALLIISGGLIWWAGVLGDALVVFAVVVVNAIMGTVQEGRAERCIMALRTLSARQARVLRGGKEAIIDAAELVPGDIVFLAAGDAVMADMRVLEENEIEVNEGVLTGESYPVGKTTETFPDAKHPEEQDNMFFSGTFVAKGRGVGVVTSTGPRTEMGKIAMLAESIPEPRTPIEMKVSRFGKQLIVAAVVIFLLFFGVGLLWRMNVSEIFLASVSQLVSIIPEGLPVAITIALAAGIQRMSRANALVRRLYAVETLGSTTVICTDKTGTLTKNEMTATQVSLCGEPVIDVEGVGYQPKGKFFEVGQTLTPHEDASLLAILKAGVLCNDANVAQKEGKWAPIGDAMEAALIVLAMKGGLSPENLRSEFPRICEIPFTTITKMMATCHKGFAIVKGALEEVLLFCIDRDIIGKREWTEDSQNPWKTTPFKLSAKPFCDPKTGQPYPRYVTHSEMRRCYKLAHEYPNPKVREIAQRTWKFVKLVQDTKTKEFRVERIPAPWEMPGWDAEWAQRKTKSKELWATLQFAKQLPPEMVKQYPWKAELAKLILKYEQERRGTIHGATKQVIATRPSSLEIAEAPETTTDAPTTSKRIRIVTHESPSGIVTLPAQTEEEAQAAPGKIADLILGFSEGQDVRDLRILQSVAQQQS